MKEYILRGSGLALMLLVVMIGCQTAKPALVTPAESAIQVEKSGFSPTGAAGQNSIDQDLEGRADKRRQGAKDLDG